ncbi:MAG: nitroreductase family deazaflavin-dependent oxidoreductase [Acidimicrobiia bacterium]|nr:nitroreductase family deazaflavin-dependent oxidoreductase [Acidimicrobiia bacterium]MBT8214898.1 nitroreductase family deazaflavin-dependent oxidoreductase [Acidimicrobiia bacterium]NNF69349.1 nitroreductase family deazaflavin-dependent oxidoreductase [Acidimicrobiia bacterium]
MGFSASLFRAFLAANVWVYRKTGGRVGSQGGKVVLLTATGRRSGMERTLPLMGITDGDRILVAASAGGDDKHPGWYHNVTANPEVTVQRGQDVFEMKARTAGPDERPALWDRFVEKSRNFAKYETRTDRQIPVVILEPREKS